MSTFSFGSWEISGGYLFDLVRRLKLAQSLVRRSIEEQIIELVDTNH